MTTKSSKTDLTTPLTEDLLQLSVPQLLVRVGPTSVYTWEKARRLTQEWVHFRDGTIRTMKRCNKSLSVDIAGTHQTGSDGHAEWLLSDFICEQPPGIGSQAAVWDEPVSFVATPRVDVGPPIVVSGSANVFLTADIELVDGGSDVRVKVMTWNAAGKPAGSVRYSFRCRVPYHRGPFVID